MDSSFNQPFNINHHVNNSFVTINSSVSNKINQDYSLNKNLEIDNNLDQMKSPLKFGKTKTMEKQFRDTNFKTIRNNVNKELCNTIKSYILPNYQFDNHIIKVKLDHIENKDRFKRIKSLDNLQKNNKKISIVKDSILNNNLQNDNNKVSTIYENLWKNGYQEDSTMTEKQKRQKKLFIQNSIKDANQKQSLENDNKEEMKITNLLNRKSESVKKIDEFSKKYKINFEERKAIYSNQMEEQLLKQQWDQVQTQRDNAAYVSHVDQWMESAMKSQGSVDNAELMRIYKIDTWEQVKKYNQDLY